MAEEVQIYTSGDTVRFSATFRDYPDDPDDPPENGDLLDPASITYTIYNSDQVAIATGTGTQRSSGVYEIDYTVPLEVGTYYIEWKGIVNSKPEIKREKFKVKFVVNS